MRTNSAVTTFILTLATTVFVAASSQATNHSGIIASNQTWFAADNPHVVVATVTVTGGVTLTIEAGVQVRLNYGTGITVSGTLTAVGTPGTEILFTRNGTSNWYALTFQTAGSGTFDHCVVEYSNYGIYASSSGTLSIANSILRNSSYGIYATSGTVTLASTTVTGNTSSGFYGSGVAPTLLDANVVIENNATGINLINVAGLSLTTAATVRNNTTTGIALSGCATPTLDNLILTGNTGANGAILMDDCGEFNLGAGNTIGGIGLANSWPLSLTAGSYPSAASVIPTTGNTNDDIRVNGGSSTRTGTWRKFTDLDYIVAGTPNVAAGGGLTIEGGVQVRLNYGVGITVGGTLTAVGTPGAEILFTHNGASNWYALYFQTAGTGTFDHCIVEYSNYGIYTSSAGTVSIANSILRNNSQGVYATNGTVNLASTTVTGNTSSGFYGNGVAPTLLDANVVIENNATGINLINVAGLNLTTAATVRNNTTTGIALSGCVTPTLDNLVLTGNTGANGAILMDDCGEFNLGAGNTIGGISLANSWPLTITAGSYPSAASVIPTSGNTNNDIRVNGGSSTRTGTWRKFTDLDYIVTATPNVPAGGALTIEDGVQVRLNYGTGITVGGTLTAVGTPGAEILFTRNGASNWYALTFQTAGTGTFDHCLVEYSNYGIYASSSGAVSIANSILRNGSYGVYATSGTVSLASTTVTGNTGSGFYGSGVPPTLLDANVVIENNATGINLINVAGLSLTTAATVRNNSTTGIALTNCVTPTLDNLVLTGNTGANGAILMDDCGEFNLGAGNTIGGAGLENTWPVTITAGSYPSTAGVIPASGNTNNDIRVNGGSSTRTGTWRKFTDLDYIVTGTPTVSAGGGLTIEGGVQVRLNYGTGITVGGTLTAVGTPGLGILFTRNGASNWYALTFQTAGTGTFDHCVVEYSNYGIYASSSGTLSIANSILRNSSYGVYATSGTVSLASTTVTGNTSSGFYGNGVAPTLLDANVVIENNATGINLINVAGVNLTTAATVRNNSTTGVALAGCVTPTLDNLVLTGNTGANGAILMDDCGEFTLGAGNTIGGAGLENTWPVTITAGSYPSAAGVIPTSGNTNNDIRVNGGASTRTGTWRKFADLDYIVTGTPTVSPGGALTIEDGVQVRLGSGVGITVGGTLTAVGTPGTGILLTRNGAGTWYALNFQSASSGTLDHCVVEYSNYGIYATSSGTVSVANSVLRNNSYGVYATNGTVVFLRNQIIDNTNYGVYLAGAAPVFGSNLSEWNDIYGNGSGNAGRGLRNGLTDIAAHYVYWGTENWNLIETMIWDDHDDAALGLVSYVPYTVADHDGEIIAVPETAPDGAIPARFDLSANFPNPFNPRTTIAFDLPRPEVVRLVIHDVAGRVVATPVAGPLPAGRHQITWQGTDDQGRALPSGVYVYRIVAGDYTEARRMLLVR